MITMTEQQLRARMEDYFINTTQMKTLSYIIKKYAAVENRPMLIFTDINLRFHNGQYDWILKYRIETEAVTFADEFVIDAENWEQSIQAIAKSMLNKVLLRGLFVQVYPDEFKGFSRSDKEIKEFMEAMEVVKKQFKSGGRWVPNSTGNSPWKYHQ